MAITLKKDTWLQQKEKDCLEKLTQCNQVKTSGYIIHPIIQVFGIPLYLFVLPWYASLIVAYILYKMTRPERGSGKIPYNMTALQAELQRYAVGRYGEDLVARALAVLPDDTYVLHDVTINGHQIDHIVVSPNAILAVETKNYSGKVISDDNGCWFYNNQKVNNAQHQALSGARAASQFLGLPVHAAVALINATFQSSSPSPCPVVYPYGVIPYIQSIKPSHKYRPVDVANRLLAASRGCYTK